MVARDYLYGWGWFFKNFSGSNHAFGFSLRQIRDFILEKAHANGELPKKSVARDWLSSRSDMVTENFGNFHEKRLLRASEHPKIRRGLALTRNLKIPRGL